MQQPLWSTERYKAKLELYTQKIFFTPKKLSFKNGGEIGIFRHGKTESLHTNGCTSPEILKKVLWEEGKSESVQRKEKHQKWKSMNKYKDVFKIPKI